MSPVVYREDDSPAWGMMAIVLVVALFALLIGYFAWWRPGQVEAEPRNGDTTIVQPQPSNPPPTIIPVPNPGAPGPPGPAGPAGPAGPSGPAAPAEPSTPSAPTGP